MKKQIFLLLVSAIAYCSCTKSPAQSLCDGETGASPKDIQTQKVTVGDFNAISATSSVDVVYIPSDDETSVEIRASKAVLPYISVQVDAHGTLVVGMKKPKDPTKTKGIKEVHVKARPVGSLSASSSGDILVKDGLHVKGTLRLTAGSSGDISCQDISCKDLHATSNSSGDISGKSVSCGLLTAASNSSGDIYFGGSKCQQADLQCNSSGDLHIKGLECTHLIATATSSGDLRLQGKCEQAKYTASSSGDIDAGNMEARHVDANASSAGDISCHATESLDAHTRGIPCKYPLQAKTYKNVNPLPQTAKGLLPANTGTVPLLFSIQADKSFIQPSAYAIRP